MQGIFEVSTNRRRRALLRLVASLAFLVVNPAFSQVVPPDETRSTIAQIVQCLAEGQEAVLFERVPVKCAPFDKGKELLDGYTPLGLDRSKVCSDASDASDLRKLPANAIKLI